MRRTSVTGRLAPFLSAAAVVAFGMAPDPAARQRGIDAAPSAAAAPENVEVLPSGATRLASVGVSAGPVFFLPKSMGCAPHAEEWKVTRDGQTPFRIHTLLGAGEKVFDGETFYRSASNGAVAVRHRFVCTSDTVAAGLYASFPLMIDSWAGGRIVFDERETVPLPREKGVMKSAVFTARTATAIRPDGRTQFTVRFSAPQPFEVADGRGWGGPAFIFRAKAVARDRFAAGETNTIAYALSTPQGLAVKTGPVTLKAGADWLPLCRFTPFVMPGSALDWTDLRLTGQPAGKDGFLRTNGQDFEFERRPGKKVRFYGVNICGDMCWGLTHDEYDRFAANLARIGYNSLRIHHHDNGLSCGPDKTALNDVNMKGLDTLVKACIDHGLYLTTDLYVSRSLTYRQLGVDRDGRPPYEAIKPLFYVSEVAYSNFLGFARNFLCHVNPFTGRRYADEPAMPLLSAVNEGSLGIDGMRGVAHFADIYRPLYEKWLAAKKASDPAYADVKVRTPFPGNVYDGSSPDNQAFLIFCAELEHRFNARVHAFLRDEIKAKALVTDMNIGYNPAVYAKTRDAFLDYVDIHFYVDHPRFPEKDWSLPSYRLNVSPLRDGRVGPKQIAPMRHLDRPFCVTEFNFCGPARLRSQSGLTLGTVAGLQNWAGVWRFGWSHHVSRHRNYATENAGGFDLVTDPTKIAEERAGLMLFGYGDLPEAQGTSAIVLPRETLSSMDGRGCRFVDRLGTDFLPYLRKVGIAVGDKPPQGAEVFTTWSRWARPTPQETRATWYPDGRIRGPHHALDVENGTLAVRTARLVGGFAESGTIQAEGFSARLVDSHAAVWATAVDGRPLAQADRFVVSHVTELQNTGAVFADLAQRFLLKYGEQPYLMRRGRAEVALAVREGVWRVYGLETCGKRRAAVPCTYANGLLTFTADISCDPSNATFLYEVVREAPPAGSTRRSFNACWQWQWEGDAAWKTADVPHDAAWDRGFDPSASGYHGYVPMDGTLRYRKTFPRPETNGVEHVIRFDGVYMDASVFLNGRRVGGRPSGFVGFDVPLDGFEATNVLEVVCNERTPSARWYPGAGILRNVWWIERRGFALQEADVAIRPELLPDGRARVQVVSDVGEVVEPRGGELLIENPRLWSPETPALYRMRVAVRRSDGMEDAVTVRYGIRSVAFTKDRGLLLNGRPYRLRGLCQHENFGCLGAALNVSALKRQLSGMKAIGANAIRTVHNPFSPEFYALCDEMGFLVMDEAFDEWEKPKVKNGYCRFFSDWAERDLAALVRRDRNHPCVMMWSIGNEIPEMRERGEAGVRWTKRLVDVVKRLDPTRPVTAGSDRPLASDANGTYAALDVVGLNYNADAFDTLKGRYAMYASETTASLCSRDSYFFSATGGVLEVVAARGFQEHSYAPRIVFPGASTLEGSLKVQMEKPWSAGEFSWSYSDYLGEPYRTGASAETGWPARSSYWGICDLAGFPKDRYFLHQALWTDAAVLHLMPDWNLPGCEGALVPVRCYTNCREAELFLNGRSLGVRRRRDTADLHLSWRVPYEPGRLEVRAVTGAGERLVSRRETVGAVASLRVTEDYADGAFAFYRIDAVDAEGRHVIACDALVDVAATGGGIVATDNGDATDHTPFGAKTRRLFGGSMLVVVRRTGGQVRVVPSFAEPLR